MLKQQNILKKLHEKDVKHPNVKIFERNLYSKFSYVITLRR